MPTVRAVECAVSNAADPRVGAPCPLVCLVCRPGGRPTFSCDPEAHAVRERPSSASAHAPGGASLYNGEMARLLGLSSAGDVSVLGRPASVMRARRTACTYPSAANPHTACCRLRIYMEGNARIYVNGQLPGPLSVHARAADLRRGRHERPASLPSLAFVVVSLAPLCICLHNAARRRDSSELGGAGAHWAGHGRVLVQFLLRNPPHTARAPAARRWVQFAPPALPRAPVHPQASISAS